MSDRVSVAQTIPVYRAFRALRCDAKEERAPLGASLRGYAQIEGCSPLSWRRRFDERS